MELKDKNILITGAASGFGKALSLFLTKQECNVIAFDINKKALTDLKTSSKNLDTYLCDITSPEQIESSLEKVLQKWNTIDVLVNNAGIMINSPLINLLNKNEKKHSLDLWHQVINVNQNAVFYMSRAVSEAMLSKRTKGLIVNLSSIAAKGNSGQTAYSASKAAVEAMTKVWAKELGRFGIRSVAIAPGFIDTQGTHDALEAKMLSKWIERTPLNRTGTISEVIRTIVFAIENDFINGETINVNGGLTI